MGIFNYSLDNVSTNNTHPKDDYEVEVLSVKYNKQEIKQGDRAGQLMHKVTVNTKIITTVNGDPTRAGKPVRIDFIVDEDAESFNRIVRFIMACHGIKAGTDEADMEFKEKFQGYDFSVDPDSGTLGNGYNVLVKQRVIVSLDLDGKSPDKMYNRMISSRPVV